MPSRTSGSKFEKKKKGAIEKPDMVSTGVISTLQRASTAMQDRMRQLAEASLACLDCRWTN